jgi:hypothetical protein
MSKVQRFAAGVAVLGILLIAAPAPAAPLVNQFVPVGVINTSAAVGEDAFGVAYDSVNDLIWHRSGGTLHGFTPFKNLVIGSLPIDGVTGLPMLAVSTGATTPTPGPGGIQALGFNSATGQIAMHNPSTGVINGFDPITGASVTLTPHRCRSAPASWTGSTLKGRWRMSTPRPNRLPPAGTRTRMASFSWTTAVPPRPTSPGFRPGQPSRAGPASRP